MTKHVSPPQKEKVIQRTPLSSKVKYIGKLSTSKDYKRSITGHFRQLGAGYLFNPRFWALYTEYGEDVMEHFKDKSIAKEQFLSDWVAILNTCDKGGNEDMCLMEPGEVISAPYSRGYKGGSREFLTNIESAFNELVFGLGEV